MPIELFFSPYNQVSGERQKSSPSSGVLKGLIFCVALKQRSKQPVTRAGILREDWKSYISLQVLNTRNQCIQQKLSRNREAGAKSPLVLTEDKKAVVLYSIQEVLTDNSGWDHSPRKLAH